VTPQSARLSPAARATAREAFERELVIIYEDARRFEGGDRSARVMLLGACRLAAVEAERDELLSSVLALLNDPPAGKDAWVKALRLALARTEGAGAHAATVARGRIVGDAPAPAVVEPPPVEVEPAELPGDVAPAPPRPAGPPPEPPSRALALEGYDWREDPESCAECRRTLVRGDRVERTEAEGARRVRCEWCVAGVRERPRGGSPGARREPKGPRVTAPPRRLVEQTLGPLFGVRVPEK